jgi:hypothetical protein
MSTVNGIKVYNIHSKENDAYIASFPTRQRCHEYMKFQKEQYFFTTGSMEDAEEQYGENSYYIEYGFALVQTCVATYNVNFSDWA